MLMPADGDGEEEELPAPAFLILEVNSAERMGKKKGLGRGTAKILRY